MERKSFLNVVPNVTDVPLAQAPRMKLWLGMTLELKPETENLIQRQLESGAYSSAEEVIERALAFLSAEADWLADNHDQIAGQIQEGWDEAQRDGLTSEDQVRAEMQSLKEDWKKLRRIA